MAAETVEEVVFAIVCSSSGTKFLTKLLVVLLLLLLHVPILVNVVVWGSMRLPSIRSEAMWHLEVGRGGLCGRG